MPGGKIYGFHSEPGIQRDGTKFSSKSYIDGQWCRWYRGLPRKMGGYSQITDHLDNIPRGLHVLPNAPYYNIYIGDSDHLHVFNIDSNGVKVGLPRDRTPNLFPSDFGNIWSFDSMFSTLDNSSILIAHAAPNLSIDSIVETPVWYGNIGGKGPLITTGINVSGGIVVLHPYLFVFGNSGNVSWTKANDPTTIVNSARVSASKIVAGYVTRGGNSSPAGLLWSLDSVIRVTEVGTGSEPEFSFDTISSDSSILSSKGIVEYDGIYFWAAVDRFLMYNGVVSELPNSMSLDRFFSTINMEYRQRVWATKITKWGEIWWHYPTGDSPDCNAAIIFNVRENVWYDTTISRACGYFDQVFNYPIWASSYLNYYSYDAYYSNISTRYSAYNQIYSEYPGDFDSISLWTHEKGTDEVIENTSYPIESYFESGSIAYVALDPNAQRQQIDRYVDLYRVEPDFEQSGRMYLVVNGKEYARSDVQSSTIPYRSIETLYSQTNVLYSELGDYVFYPDTDKIDIRQQGREITLKFVSNVVGGNYVLGQTLITVRIGDVRQ